jgi:hypothetical protein
MATVLEECTAEEQHSIVCFLWAKGLNAKDIHKEIFTAGSACRVKRFTTGSRNVADVSLMKRLKRRCGSISDFYAAGFDAPVKR